jgi:hypothetical protein
MGTEVNANNILLGRGKVYFDRFTDAGVQTGEIFLGNTPTFELTPASEDIKKYSSATAAAPLICSDVLRVTVGIRIVGDEFSKENLAMALFGTVGSYTQSTAGVVDESITVVEQGRFYPTLYRGLTAVVVTTDPAGTTYTVDVDYTVDAVSGRIYIVPGGAIAASAAEDILVDYTYATQALEATRGLTATSVKGRIRFIGDPARGPKLECIVWRASVRSDGAISFIGDEYGQFTLAGDVESDAVNHPTEPHYRIIKIS